MNWWNDHGTKLLGTAVAAVAAFQLGLPQLQDLVSKPRYAILQIGTSVLLAVLGSLTVKRGFTNSAAADSTGQQSGV